MSCGSYETAIDKAQDTQFDIVFFDSKSQTETYIPEGDFVRQMKLANTKMVMIAVSTTPSPENIFTVIKNGARGYAIPPFTPQALEEIITQAAQGPRIDRAILERPDRNRALVEHILNHLNNLVAYVRSINDTVFSSSEKPDGEKVLEMNRYSITLSESVRAALMFCEGGQDALLEEMVDECCRRASVNTKLGKARRELQKKRAT